MNRDIISIQMKLLSLPLIISTSNLLSFTPTVELGEEEMFFFIKKMPVLSMLCPIHRLQVDCDWPSITVLMQITTTIPVTILATMPLALSDCPLQTANYKRGQLLLEKVSTGQQIFQERNWLLPLHHIHPSWGHFSCLLDSFLHIHWNNLDLRKNKLNYSQKINPKEIIMTVVYYWNRHLPLTLNFIYSNPKEPDKST